MTRRTLSGQERSSLNQPRTPEGELDIHGISTVYQAPPRPISDLPRDSSQQPPPPTNPASIKWEWPRQPRTHVGNQNSRSSLDWFGSEGELDGSSSTSDSDSDDTSCGESEHGRREAASEYVLPHGHRFHTLRRDLVLFILEILDPWMESARYVPPPDDRLLLRKPCRTSNWQVGDDSDGGLVVVSPPVGYFRLACPFYVANPAKYQDCLLKHDLQASKDVISHLRRHHMKPPYCPICSRSFDTLSSRDSHILEGACELRDLQPIDGINFYQKSKLKRRDRVCLGEARRWHRIYATVFPGSDPPRSQYLDKGCGKAVSMARDFWRAKGQCSISKFLESRKMLGEQEVENDAQDELCKLVLEDTLQEIVKRHGGS